VTGTRNGEPLCDEPIDAIGGLCDNTAWRDGKCAVHWGNPTQSRKPPPAPTSQAPKRGRRSKAGESFRRPLDREPGYAAPLPRGMDYVWWQCRRWDRLYDATLRRPADH
jgi:hypothetical protein